DVTVNNPVPRGKMYDRNGKIIVDNTPLNAITYTKKQNADPQEMLKTAEKLSKLINMNTSNPYDPDYLKKTVHDRDQRDFWLVKYPQKAQALVTKSELKKLDSKQIYNLQLKRIKEKDLSSLDLNTVAIFRQMNGGYALTPQIIKNQNVTPQEYAVVSENLTSLPGVDTTTDWDRSYAFGDTLKTILGTVSSSQQGIPKEELDKFLAQGYSRNDRVGTSYIEQEYEDVLQGDKAKLKSVTDKSGNVISTQTVSEGQRGKDLVLTIDMDLQQQVENIISAELTKTKANPGSRLLDRAFVVLMDPHTGDILTMAGKQIVDGKMQDFALGNITTSYNVGSAVKGATVLTGYATGAIKPGQIQVDEPLNIKGTPLIKSWKTFGSIDDERALQVSSNVYMWKTVIAMAGGHYAPGQPLDLNYKAFDTIRQSFAQFGLGSLTGIDLPNEMAGFKGAEKSPGKLMYLGIGQYDTYTTMQLAQYVSTIANGGYRVQPHIVKEIREPSNDNQQMGSIVETIQPKILDKINAQDSWIQRVHQGFKMVMQVGDGTAVKYFGTADYDPAGKTGTAQAFYDGPLRSQFGKNDPEVMNLSMVAFAPESNPEIAMAVLVPWAYEGATGPSPNEEMGRQVLDAYFNLKKQRQQAGQLSPSSVNSVQNAGTSQGTQQNSSQGQ
ncbi:MAG: penicillin-binding protein 2, partial [Bacillota bacterium]|nr:penicillin-binding protein 2 [Bacillota bacterium]